MANSPQLKNRSMAKNKTINVKGTEITIIQNDSQDFISLTDMANSKESESRAAENPGLLV